MEPESLPWIAGLVTAFIALRGVHGHRPPYETGYTLEVLTFTGVLFVTSGLGRALFLDMTEVLILLAAGASGGFVLGLGMALNRYVEGGVAADCVKICGFSTGICAAIGLVGGSLFLI
jgi:hypothetical protein